MTSSPDVIVIGAGVLGLCTAAELASRGHAVTVIDPGGANASSVAAGMLAPALECLSDKAGPERVALLTRARDLWPEFATRHGLTLHQDGAEWRDPDAGAAIARLTASGFSARPVPGGLFTPDDWRVEVGPALLALSRVAGVTAARATVARVAATAGRWRVEAADGRAWFPSTIVLATGAAPPVPGLPDRIAGPVAAIEPFRGQLTPVAGRGPAHTVRAPGLYVVPTPTGWVAGATMEGGRRDLEPDIEVSYRQVAAAEALSGLVGTPGEPRVGIRGGTADGLPLAGVSGEPGLHLALAPLRNGWLLGPMVAGIVADGIEGRAPGPDAAALDPLRFSSPAA
ncbi:MAG: NAD(P)/FAD-dependent oxidoreductase [Brevundimonas sp.]|uniref:NAD(P)/FAD-dependent oxidoreductase n=1 Tax=Brevundimonas sp. TaxID=1871086 RepID=UPI003919BF50